MIMILLHLIHNIVLNTNNSPDVVFIGNPPKHEKYYELDRRNHECS